MSGTLSFNPQSQAMMGELSSLGIPMGAMAGLAQQSTYGNPAPAPDGMPSVPFAPGQFGQPAPSQATIFSRPPDKVTTKQTTTSGGGGGLGGILPVIGDAAAVVAAPFTGGASLAAIPVINGVGGALNQATNGQV